MIAPATPPAPHPFDFFSGLVWLDGRPLMDTIESYRREVFDRVLYGYDPTGAPLYNRALIGRAKKNNKTTDLILAALYRLLAWHSDNGNDCFILANDEGQAADDLSLAKKLVACNPILAREVTVKAKEIVRNDGRGTLAILPAGDTAGSHGKTYLFLGYDEIHGYRNYDLFEALSPDPTRRDVLTWITSYAGIRHAPGIPLYDFFQGAKAGDDRRMYFQWYAGDFTTDATVRGDDVTPERRANPSMASWADPLYLDEQRRRLPSHKFRRLHLNLPGAPDGAAFSGEHVAAAIVLGRRRLPPEDGIRYCGFVDMSHGSHDDACFAVAHRVGDLTIVDLVVSQGVRPPFHPRIAIRKFAPIAKEYRITTIVGDAIGGQTYRLDFKELGVNYRVIEKSKSELYEELEPKLNSRDVELPDVPELQEQLLTLVWRGSKIDHQSGDHDDWANAVAGAVSIASKTSSNMIASPAELRRIASAPYARQRFGGALGPPQGPRPGRWSR